MEDALEPDSEDGLVPVHSIVLDWTPVCFIDSVAAKAVKQVQRYTWGNLLRLSVRSITCCSSPQVIKEYAAVGVTVVIAGCSSKKSLPSTLICLLVPKKCHCIQGFWDKRKASVCDQGHSLVSPLCSLNNTAYSTGQAASGSVHFHFFCLLGILLAQLDDLQFFTGEGTEQAVFPTVHDAVLRCQDSRLAATRAVESRVWPQLLSSQFGSFYPIRFSGFSSRHSCTLTTVSSLQSWLYELCYVNSLWGDFVTSVRQPGRRCMGTPLIYLSIGDFIVF